MKKQIYYCDLCGNKNTKGYVIDDMNKIEIGGGFGYSKLSKDICNNCEGEVRNKLKELRKAGGQRNGK